MSESQPHDQPEESPLLFYRERIHAWAIGISGFFWLLSFGIIWHGIGRREAAIVLHYNAYFGIDLLGAWWQAYYIPLSGSVIWLFHILLARKFFRMGERSLSQVTLFSLIFLESMILVASLTIWTVNY